tara:strand:- start:3098 stop:3619 length:522 start_codon:yes stop_codon:yes gene_type:complete
MIVILIGYMASGKSTLGKYLAKKLHYNFIDLDLYIEAKEEMPIKNIFEKKGEIYFRKIESLSLIEILKNKNNIVLSLGGGTPCYSDNMDVILKSKHVKSVYLKASIPSLVNRLKNETSKRPLISHLETEEQIIEFIGKHLFERTPFYNQAHLTIYTDDKPKKDIIEELLSVLI